MAEISLKVNKREVYDEVAQTTSYTGAKKEEEEGAYDRIFTTRGDESQLERFWAESCIKVTSALKQHLQTEAIMEGDDFIIGLRVSSSFDTHLTETIEKELRSYFVMSITGKWFVFTNKGESAAYRGEAEALLEGVKRKVCHKKRPSRPRYVSTGITIGPGSGLPEGDMPGQREET